MLRRRATKHRREGGEARAEEWIIEGVIGTLSAAATASSEWKVEEVGWEVWSIGSRRGRWGPNASSVVLLMHGMIGLAQCRMWVEGA